MLNIDNSIKNILDKITQEQVDIWAKNHNTQNILRNKFVSEFNDFTKKGLISLLIAIQMSYENNFDDDSITKALPEGLRHASPQEKPDWIGPRGGKYVKIKPKKQISNVSNIDNVLFHGTDNLDNVKNIISEGLKQGSSISSNKGQASSYGIILEFDKFPIREVYYRPGDFISMGKSGKPKAIYVDTEYWGEGVRSIDEINNELAKILENLEAQGISPEEFGYANRRKQYQINKRAGQLMDELDKAIELSARGIKGQYGGEDVLSEVKSIARNIPVKKVVRDYEGDIDWKATRESDKKENGKIISNNKAVNELIVSGIETIPEKDSNYINKIIIYNKENAKDQLEPYLSRKYGDTWKKWSENENNAGIDILSNCIIIGEKYMDKIVSGKDSRFAKAYEDKNPLGTLVRHELGHLIFNNEKRIPKGFRDYWRRIFNEYKRKGNYISKRSTDDYDELFAECYAAYYDNNGREWLAKNTPELKNEFDKLTIDKISKAMPQGMRSALPQEKPDWIGPRGGRYIKPKEHMGEPTGGTCYEEAWRYAIKNDGTLTHGSIQMSQEGKRIKHAWVELPNNKIYEPQMKQLFDKKDFYRMFLPIVNNKYTTTEAAIKLGKEGYHGAWDDPEIKKKNIDELKQKVKNTVPSEFAEYMYNPKWYKAMIVSPIHSEARIMGEGTYLAPTSEYAEKWGRDVREVNVDWNKMINDNIKLFIYSGFQRGVIDVKTGNFDNNGSIRDTQGAWGGKLLGFMIPRKYVKIKPEEANNKLTKTIKALEENAKIRELKERILGNIQTFLDKHKEKEDFLSNTNEIELEKSIQIFLKEYEKLALLSKEYSDEEVNKLFKLTEFVNINKQFNKQLNSSNRIEKVISIDEVARSLHKEKDENGNSRYEILDELALISKNYGEPDRSVRLMVLQHPDKIDDIEKLCKLEILKKSELERSNKFWRLCEKAIKFGIEKLSDFELIALREWLYAKI